MTKTLLYRTRGERVVKAKSPKEKTTSTAHLAMATHALGRLYQGFVLQKEARQLNTAEAIDELSRAGALVKLPREFLEASGFQVPTATVN